MPPTRIVALMLFSIASGPALAQAGEPLAGEWDVFAASSHGTAGGRMVLSVEGGEVSGTSAPLDANMYWPLSVTGTGDDGTLILTFRSDDEPVGTVRVTRDRLEAAEWLVSEGAPPTEF